MAGKDTVAKDLLKRIVVNLARYLFGLEIEALEVLDTEQQRVEDRRADLVVLAREGSDETLLHVEIQNDNDPRMPLQILRSASPTSPIPDSSMPWTRRPMIRVRSAVSRSRMATPRRPPRISAARRCSPRR